MSRTMLTQCKMAIDCTMGSYLKKKKKLFWILLFSFKSGDANTLIHNKNIYLNFLKTKIVWDFKIMQNFGGDVYTNFDYHWEVRMFYLFPFAPLIYLCHTVSTPEIYYFIYIIHPSKEGKRHSLFIYSLEVLSLH